MSRTLTHAGAIAVRPDKDGLRVLIVTAKRHPERWIFPKGHIEPGEQPAATALRELREEAGVEGKVIGPVGRMAVTSRGEKGLAEYYLARYVRDVPAEDERQVRWLPVNQARARLTYANAKRLLDQAVAQLHRA